MRAVTIAAVATLLSADLLAAQPLRFEPRAVAEGRWWKGNTHAHTLESDGDSPPETVVAWYKAHGYAWLVLSDHNVFTDPVRFRTMQDSAFLLIPGEELTSAAEGKAIHVNGLNLPGLVRPESASTILETVQRNVDAVRRVEGVPHVNHPNFLWSIGPEVLARLERDKLFELYNGHPIVHNEGGGDRPSMEAVWDTLLARGKRMYGIAVDDAHHFQGEFAPERANPGRGWVAVRARRLDAQALMTALEAGDFYASNGVDLRDVQGDAQTLTVTVARRGDYRYSITWIGEGGRVLARATGDTLFRYTLPTDETTRYVRARITDSGGRHAWIQPFFTTRAP